MSAYLLHFVKYNIILFLNIIILLSASNVFGEIFSASTQNDLVVGTDERYTSGLSFDWMSDIKNQNDLEISESFYINFVHSTISFLSLVKIQSDNLTFGFKIAQDIYTPIDTCEEELIEDDIPYAGHLYTKYSLFEWKKASVQETYFRIGVVGPSSGAEGSQKAAHWMIANDEPKGWHNQLQDYPTLGIGHSHSYNVWQSTYGSGKRSDWVPSYGFEIGNFVTGLYTGMMFRFGNNYPANQIPIYGSINTGLNSGLALNSIDYKLGWSVNAGAYINAVAYSHIIDSSEKHDIKRKVLAGLGVAGVSFYIKNIQVFFSVQSINMNINDSIYTSGWGAISVSFCS